MGNESLGNSSRVSFPSPIEETPTMVVRNNVVNNNVNNVKATYKECQKNHAITRGGQVLDDCCEFLAAGPEGSLEALKCAACNCHRNFHRKEAPLPPPVVTVATLIHATVFPAGEVNPPYNHHSHQVSPPPHYTIYRSRSGPAPSGPPLISPARGGVCSEDHDDAINVDNGGIGLSSNSKKRFRTKFTTEQKEKMKDLAERLDWRIQKQDEVIVQEFCIENGVKGQVLKVWMNNNKHTIGKKL